MKKIVAGLAFCLPFLSHAESFSMSFDRMPLVNFAEATYRNMLRRDYILSPDLISMEKPISLHARNIDGKALPKFIETILSQQRIRSTEKDGVYFLSLESTSGDGTQRGGQPFMLSGSLVGSDSPRDPRQDQRRADVSVPVSGYPLAGDLGQFDKRVIYRPINRKSEFISTALNAVFSAKGSVVAGGALVLSAPKDQIDALVDLAQQIDIAPHKVKISATFVEVSTSASSGRGVSVAADVLGAKFGVKIGDTSAGSLSIGSQSFQAVLDVLNNDGRFKQVSSPSSVVDDYDKANISFGDSVPTIASSSLDKNGNPIQQIVYQQSGVILDVIPRVLGSGKINVTVDGQVSSFSATTTGVSTSPTLSKRQVQTSLTLDDGELLVIGGLNSNKTVNNTTGFSFLPKTWSARSDSDANVDLLLILSATVVK